MHVKSHSRVVEILTAAAALASADAAVYRFAIEAALEVLAAMDQRTPRVVRLRVLLTDALQAADAAREEAIDELGLRAPGGWVM